jgi:putative ABC transport system ATP-binding protein
VTSLPPTTYSPHIAAARAVKASKIYGSGDSEVRALDGIDVQFEKGKFTAIMGPSGSGKSTLMHCIAGLDSLTDGQVFIGDVDLSSLSDKQLTELRREKVGFIFQAFNLIPTLSAEENILLPLTLGRRKGDVAWIDRSSTPFHFVTDSSIAPASCRVDNNNVLPSRVHLPANPTSSSPTNRPATSTQRRAARCCSSCGVPSPTSVRPS